MSKKKVAQIVVEALENAGVKRCYGVVGDTLNQVTDAMRFHTSIEWVHMRHEEAGGFAAGAEAYMTDNLTACAGSCGPGSLHFLNGLFESHRNGAPVVLIASQLPSDVLGTSFPQEVDYTPIYKTCSVFCEQVNDASTAKRIVMSACQAALTQRGVAVVILPANISAMEIEDLPVLQTYQPKQPIVHPADEELRMIAKILNEGQKVGIYAGAGAKGAHDEIIALCKKLQAPMAHTSLAKDFVEWDNDYNIGMTGMLGMQAGYHMMETCDTLLILGANFAWSQFYPKHARIIQVDINPQHLGLRHAIELGVIGNVKDTVTALLPYLDEKDDTKYLNEHLKLHQKCIEKLGKKVVAGADDLIHPQYLVELLNEYADKDALIAGDCGSAMAWILRHFQTNGERRTMLSMKHGTMANAMPQAIGLQKAYPDRQVISLSGDGGLTMLMGDLLTIVQEKLPIKIAILNNGALDFVELEMKAEGIVNSYTDLHNPDFSKLADAVGMKGFSVKGSHDLESVVKEFLAFDGPAILDVHTSRLELLWPPHTEASNYTNMALYGAKAILGGQGKDFIDMLKDNFLKK